MKHQSVVKIVAIVIISSFVGYGLVAFKANSDHKTTRKICRSIQPSMSMESLRQLVADNSWYHQEKNNHSGKISPTEHGCYCYYTYKDGMVLQNYGAVCSR